MLVQVRSRALTMLSSRIIILSRLLFTTSSLSPTNSSHHHQFTIPFSSSSFSSPSLLSSSPVKLEPHRSLLNSHRLSSPFLSSRRGVSSAPMDASRGEIEVSYLGQQAAKEIDEILMGPLGFSVDQLMVSRFVICFVLAWFSSNVLIFLRHRKSCKSALLFSLLFSDYIYFFGVLF